MAPKVKRKVRHQTPEGLPADGDIYIVEDLHPEDPEHQVLITPEVVESRKQLYGLTTDAQVVEVILWEVFAMLRPERYEEIPRTTRDAMEDLHGVSHLAQDWQHRVPANELPRLRSAKIQGSKVDERRHKQEEET